MEKTFRERFIPRKCPKCCEFTKPITDGTTNEIHGYKLICPFCNNFIGWGGKVNKIYQEAKNAKKQHDDNEPTKSN